MIIYILAETEIPFSVQTIIEISISAIFSDQNASEKRYYAT